MSPDHRERGMKILQFRWAPEILLALAERPRRFNWLLQDIIGISDRMLAVRLRELEDAHLVERHVETGPPIAVYYRLTDAALPYIAPLEQLRHISKEVIAAKAS